MANNMPCLNNGKSTHTNRRTGKESTPDVTMVHANQAERYDWSVSHHKPIVITRHAENRSQVNNNAIYKWNLGKANFKEFSEQVERDLPKEYERKNINKLEQILRKTIIKAANKNVKKKEITKDSKPMMSQEVKEKIKERDKLRKNIKSEPEGRTKWIESCKEVRELIRKEKEDSWEEYVEDLETTTNSQ